MSDDYVRPAIPADAAAIAYVHVEGWKTTYRSIIPDSVLDELSFEQRQAFWAEMLTAPRPDSVAMVGCDPTGVIQGFAVGGRERTSQLGCDGELMAIYLLSEARGRGLGSLLVRRVAQELGIMGFGSMAVWVLERNPYRRFYEKLGGELIGSQQIDRGGQSLEELAYGWRDIDSLISRASGESTG